MTERVQTLVIGAGAVGLAVARGLARSGREVIVLEAAAAIGTGTSSRNSEVIHAGIYYPTHSNKARWCVAGKEALYAFCREYGVPHQRCGKLIVASEESQVAVLDAYRRQARANGAGMLRWLSAAEVERLEPEVRAVGAVLSESTGILDSHAYMLALQGDLEHHGGMVALATRVSAIRARRDRLEVEAAGLVLEAAEVVNCAGLEAVKVAEMLPECRRAGLPEARFAKGHYFSYSGAAPFSRLVYPIAEPGGLGVHVTLDMAGQVRFGPDVQWQDRIDYTFDDSDARREAFCAAIERYFPRLDRERLQPGYTGIRPKISGPREPAADFRLDGPAHHGVAGLVNLLGIESPGLTASLAIADTVRDCLDAAAR